jgi:hypothetical protein
MAQEKYPQTKNSQRLLFRFFVGCIFLAPFAKLLELNFALNFLLILSGPVICSLTSFTGQFY